MKKKRNMLDKNIEICKNKKHNRNGGEKNGYK